MLSLLSCALYRVYGAVIDVHSDLRGFKPDGDGGDDR